MVKKEIEIRDGVILVTGVTEDEVKLVLEKYQHSKVTGQPFISDIRIIACPPESWVRKWFRRLLNV